MLGHDTSLYDSIHGLDQVGLFLRSDSCILSNLDPHQPMNQ